MVVVADGVGFGALVGALAAAVWAWAASSRSSVHVAEARVGPRWLAAGLIALALAAAAGTPAAHELAAHRGPGGLSAVVLGAAVVETLGVFLIAAVLIHSAVQGPKRRRRTVELAALCGVCLVVLLVLHTSNPLAPDLSEGAGVPATLTAGGVIRGGYVGLALGVIVVLAGRIGRRPETDRLAVRGLWIAQLGAVSGLCYAAVVLAGSVDLIGRDAMIDALDSVFISVGVLGLAAGYTATAWLPLVRCLALYVRAFHARSRLRPMHALVAGHAPRIRGEAGAYEVTGRLGSPVVGLAHLVIRIRDGQRALRCYRHPDAGRWTRDLAAAQQLDARTTELLAEAAEFATALDAADGRVSEQNWRQSGDEPKVTSVGNDRRRWARRAGDLPPPPRAVPDVMAESRRLLAILSALLHSPTVDAVRRRAAGSRDDGGGGPGAPRRHGRSRLRRIRAGSA
jgi:hypothetical protein